VSRKVKKVKTGFYLAPEIAKAFKTYCAERSVSMSEKAEVLIEREIEKQRKTMAKRIAPAT